MQQNQITNTPSGSSKKWLEAPSLRASVRDGMAHAVMIGSGENYISAFAIFLQATTVQIGLLAGLPPFIGAIFQSVSVFLIERLKDRRRMIVGTAVLQGLCWIPIGCIPFFFLSSTAAIGTLILLFTLYHALAGMGAPIWNSLIGELVPNDIRGKFFGYRNACIGFCTLVALLGCGQLLDVFDARGATVYGFLGLFLIAALARGVSVWNLLHYDNPPFETHSKHHFTFFQFILRVHRSNFARFVLFVSVMNGAVAFSAPYFSVYMLRVLKLSYGEFTALSATTAITQLLTMQHWGRLTDRFGTKHILNFCGYGVVLAPILWVFTDNFYFLFFIQAYGGFMWAGFNLAAFNFMFDAVSPPKRARCAAYQAIVNATFVLVASLLGGLAARHAPETLTIGTFSYHPATPLFFIFIASGLMRLIGAYFMLPLFKEVRSITPIDTRELIFHITHLRPIAGATFALFTRIRPRTTSKKE
jgi:MFS family permease